MMSDVFIQADLLKVVIFCYSKLSVNNKCGHADTSTYIQLQDKTAPLFSYLIKHPDSTYLKSYISGSYLSGAAPFPLSSFLRNKTKISPPVI